MLLHEARFEGALTIPALPSQIRGNRLTQKPLSADECVMDELAVTGNRGAWRARLGAGLSVGVAGVALTTLVRTSTGDCAARAARPMSIDLTPLLFFGLTAIALLLDLRAIRRGGAGARWGRAGLFAISAAALLGIWSAGAALLGHAGC